MRRRGHDDADLAYMRSLSAAVVQRSPRHLMTTLLMMALSVAAAIAWMHHASIDVVVRGDGKVVPKQQLQVVQTLEGGVVAEIDCVIPFASTDPFACVTPWQGIG